jgi:hypothetical protein
MSKNSGFLQVVAAEYPRPKDAFEQGIPNGREVIPVRTASVHKRARSFALSCDIANINAQTSDEHLI